MSAIKIEEFRTANHITQHELAKFIGTSRSFLSLVETGKCKLPDDKIDRIISGGIERGWDVSFINPDYARLVEIAQYLYRDEETPDNPSINHITGENILGIPKFDILEIKYGRRGIDDKIADQISSLCGAFRREWLLTGEGNFFDESNDPDYCDMSTEEIILSKLDNFNMILSQLDFRMKAMEDKMDQILRAK